MTVLLYAPVFWCHPADVVSRRSMRSRLAALQNGLSTVLLYAPVFWCHPADAVSRRSMRSRLAALQNGLSTVLLYAPPANPSWRQAS
ncbi:hypothetical protein [Bifidobacterium catulorum]|uniref:hypothetical protein n=1 Tax=Bifidobacterium catulorum TaxID=1630173 RepID=UPI0011B24016|nr:hypothetical protein [Bifidobacterium catulorum]